MGIKITKSIAKIDKLAIATSPTTNSLAYRLSQFLASGDGDWAGGQPLPSNVSLFDIIGNFTGAYNGTAADDNIKAILDLMRTQITVGEATGDADLDDSEYDYTSYTNILTVTAPATGLSACRIDLDLNKATTGWDTVVDAADTIDVCLVAQVDGTNYRGIANATQVTAQGDGSLAINLSGITFDVGPLQANKSLQVHVKLSADSRGDAEIPYRVTYVGAAPTVTPVAAG